MKLILPCDSVKITVINRATQSDILQSNPGLRLKIVILNGIICIICAIVSNNDIVFYMPINSVREVLIMGETSKSGFLLMAFMMVNSHSLVTAVALVTECALTSY